MQQAKRGDWVQIHAIILPVGQRATKIPPETQLVPLEMRCKGFLSEEQASLGEEVLIATAAGRELHGILVAINPSYCIDYGSPQPELLGIGEQLNTLLEASTNA